MLQGKEDPVPNRLGMASVATHIHMILDIIHTLALDSSHPTLIRMDTQRRPILFVVMIRRQVQEWVCKDFSF